MDCFCRKGDALGQSAHNSVNSSVALIIINSFDRSRDGEMEKGELVGEDRSDAD